MHKAILDKAQMNKALAEAAGTVDGVVTPLNYEEAKGLLQNWLLNLR